MRREAVSQLPVMGVGADAGRIVGVIDESDILLAVYNDAGGFGSAVSSAMSTNLETLRPSAPLSAVQSLLERGLVALVADDDIYYGLVTRSDLLNHLRRRARDEVPAQRGQKT